MVSPVGYTSLRELEEQCRRGKALQFTDKTFRDCVCDLAKLHAFDGGQGIVRQSRHVLSFLGGNYAFVARPSWKISLDAIRVDFSTDDSDAIRVGMFCVQESMDSFPGTEFAFDLRKYEGWHLVVADVEAEAICEAFNDPLKSFECSTEQIEKAFTEAKSRRIQHMDGGPQVPSDLLLIAELCWAMDSLEGCDPDSNRSQYCPLVYETVLCALESGELIAKTLDVGHVIGRACWRTARRLDPNGPSAYYSDFWHPYISSDNQCEGMVGESPVIDRSVARDWLLSSNAAANNVIHKRFHTREEANSAFKDYVASFQYPEHPTEKERNAWGEHHGLTQLRVRELQRELAPDYWKKPGRRRDARKTS